MVLEKEKIRRFAFKALSQYSTRIISEVYTVRVTGTYWVSVPTLRASSAKRRRALRSKLKAETNPKESFKRQNRNLTAKP